MNEVDGKEGARAVGKCPFGVGKGHRGRGKE